MLRFISHTIVVSNLFNHPFLRRWEGFPLNEEGGNVAAFVFNIPIRMMELHFIRVSENCPQTYEHWIF